MGQKKVEIQNFVALEKGGRLTNIQACTEDDATKYEQLTSSWFKKLKRSVTKDKQKETDSIIFLEGNVDGRDEVWLLSVYGEGNGMLKKLMTNNIKDYVSSFQKKTEPAATRAERSRRLAHNAHHTDSPGERVLRRRRLKSEKRPIHALMNKIRKLNGLPANPNWPELE